MARAQLEFDNVTFWYEKASEPVFAGLSVGLRPGWTGVIGPNGSGKTTLLRLACGQLAPQVGSVRGRGRLVLCHQRTDRPPDQLGAFLSATDAAAGRLRGRLGVAADWPGRWDTLSHGERKRAQIAVALWQEPTVFAVDEPTNHIDYEARRLLADALGPFRGIGLLVSHDRDLLDALCGQCLIVRPPGVDLRPGGYTKATALVRADQELALRLHAQARQELTRLRREATRRRRTAAAGRRRLSKRGLRPGQSDAREKIDRARLAGKDAQAGRLLRQMEGRLRQARDRLSGIRLEKRRPLGVRMLGEPCPRSTLFRLDAGAVTVGTGRLAFPELAMGRADRVALTGPNGAGKSTLVRHVLSQVDLPEGRVVYLPQELPRERAREVAEAARALPAGDLGDVMSYVSRLGSQPERLLETDQPSPGETRKLILALGMLSAPHLVVMDEPTNHLDLPSIECMEEALAECRCGLLMVSHDMRFLRRLCGRWWAVEAGRSADARLRVTQAPPPPRLRGPRTRARCEAFGLSGAARHGIIAPSTPETERAKTCS